MNTSAASEKEKKNDVNLSYQKTCVPLYYIRFIRDQSKIHARTATRMKNQSAKKKSHTCLPNNHPLYVRVYVMRSHMTGNLQGVQNRHLRFAARAWWKNVNHIYNATSFFYCFIPYTLYNNIINTHTHNPNIFTI